MLWVERVAKAYELAPLCPVYKFNGTTFAANTQAGCTNFAIGGARINNPAASGGAAAPLSIGKQLTDAAAKGWGAKDLVLVDGGGNDAADVVGAYLGASADQGAAYQALLLTLIPATTLQTCIVHLIRAANRWVSYQDRKPVSSALREVYTAPNEDTARAALDAFEASELGLKYPQSVKVWRDAWDRFVPFLQFPPAARRVLYTTLRDATHEFDRITQR